MKIIAFYLPQFHTIPENDEWWGKGFTEWTNVRKARPIFDGHDQPRVPLNHNYYDLSKADTLLWQAQLARQYGIHAFCFYHYWFNGKLLLEKPAELLLANQDIPLRFCFSWANEPWARTWNGKAHQVIMPQSYGTEADWRQHFVYLLPFFKDARYIKENGRPMFLIYKASSIPCARQMMESWDRWAQEAGFQGLHFVETLRDRHQYSDALPFQAKVEFEPARVYHSQTTAVKYAMRLKRKAISAINFLFHRRIPLNRPKSFKEMATLSEKLMSPEGTYAGAFAGWDNTPRRGLSGSVILPPTKEEFKDYLQAKVRIGQEVYHTDYLFINAWNEWAEGTVLEPDQSHQYQYLEAIKEITQTA